MAFEFIPGKKINIFVKKLLIGKTIHSKIAGFIEK